MGASKSSKNCKRKRKTDYPPYNYDRHLSPPAYAHFAGVEAAQVIGWIRRGELRAINMADKRGGRPRYKIPAEAIRDFEKLRESRSAPKNKHRKPKFDDIFGLLS